MYTLIGIFNNQVTQLDPTPSAEEYAIRAAVYCAEDWDRVVVKRDGVEIGHAKVPSNRNKGAVWYPKEQGR